MRRILVLVAAMPWLVPGANADNGVLEINEACVSVGCFSGDDPDWPVEIENAGSYVLTSNLIVPDENTDGIVVSANDVNIDLNGFAIIGAACVDAATAACRPTSGTGTGVKFSSPEKRNISVKNGSITGMGFRGVDLAYEALVTNLRVRWNRGDGISVGAGSMVLTNIASSNGEDGIDTLGRGTVSGNTAFDNVGNGISVEQGSTVSGNTVTYNDGDGIAAQTALVSGNLARGNKGFGLKLTGSQPSYVDNNLTNNSDGGVSGGTNRGGNFCYGNEVVSSSCP